MKLISVNVGLPREVPWRSESVRTAIFKQPVEGRTHVHRLHLEGDGQADLRVHGGPSKAVYAYPSQHYAFWAKQLPRVPLQWGHFGENLGRTATAGLLGPAPRALLHRCREVDLAARHREDHRTDVPAFHDHTVPAPAERTLDFLHRRPDFGQRADRRDQIVDAR